MIEDILPDGRHCRLTAFRLPAASDGPAPDIAASFVVVRCEIDGLPPIDVPLEAGWADAAQLPPGLAELIIRHFLMR